MIIQPLWFTAVHCRTPDTRRRAIATLLKHHRNEVGLDSWFADYVARELMYLEEGSQVVHDASDVLERDRILLRGFEYVDDQLYLCYMYAAKVGLPGDIALQRHALSIPQDPHGTVQLRKPNRDVEHLYRVLVLEAQATPLVAPRGYLVPIYCDGEFVDIVVPTDQDA